VTALAVGTRFPAWSPASEGQFRAGLLDHPGMSSLPVHPTQLYEAAGCLLTALLLSRWGPRNKRFDGQVALLALLLYAGLRSAIELVRDDDRGALLGVSTSQWLSLAVVLAVARTWRRWAADARPS
jgi:phosphatidylglycerol:prolipoprotein diacylglycerol transferase